jgi:hypothetical protein
VRRAGERELNVAASCQATTTSLRALTTCLRLTSWRRATW